MANWSKTSMPNVYVAHVANCSRRELVCLGADGRPDFHRLRRRLTASRGHAASLLAAWDPATLIVFDVLHLDGRAVRALPVDFHGGQTGPLRDAVMRAVHIEA